MQNSSKTKNTSVVETSKSKPAFARKPRIITESAIVGLSSAPVTICATSKPSKQTANVKTQSKSKLVRKPTGTINAKIFQQVLGYPESLHSNILGRVRTAYDRWELNVQYDGDGNPKTNKIIGFMKKSSVKIGGAIQDVSPSTTLLRVAQESVWIPPSNREWLGTILASPKSLNQWKQRSKAEVKSSRCWPCWRWVRGWRHLRGVDDCYSGWADWREREKWGYWEWW